VSNGPGVGSTAEVTVERLVAGGDGLARMPDGRVAFVPAVANGEVVQIELTNARRDHVRGRVVSITTRSADRVEPPCPNVAAGCGGCSWQHLSLPAQHEAKVEIVRDAFRRIARIDDVDAIVRRGGSIVEAAGTNSGSADVAVGGGWRTTVRAAVDGQGRAGFRIAGSHDICVSGPCLVAHPVVAFLLDRGRFFGNSEVFIRVGTTGKETIVMVEGDTKRIEIPSLSGLTGFQDWKAPLVLSWDELHLGMPGAVHEEVGGVTFQVSAPSFFQSGPAAASLLVEAVGVALKPYGTAEVFVDLYGGVGLFAATVGKNAKTVMVLEEAISSVNDAELNLPSTAVVHRKDVTEWEPPRIVRRSQKTHVVADPARAGLGERGVTAVLSAEPDVVVLVSCDAAAGARDIALFAEAGWTCRSATVLEVFPHTAHVEIVSVLEPTQG
jgi:23S rRNA (uracil1939-C5)-methyltransferase